MLSFYCYLSIYLETSLEGSHCSAWNLWLLGIPSGWHKRCFQSISADNLSAQVNDVLLLMYESIYLSMYLSLVYFFTLVFSIYNKLTPSLRTADVIIIDHLLYIIYNAKKLRSFFSLFFCGNTFTLLIEPHFRWPFESSKYSERSQQRVYMYQWNLTKFTRMLSWRHCKVNLSALICSFYATPLCSRVYHFLHFIQENLFLIGCLICKARQVA